MNGLLMFSPFHRVKPKAVMSLLCLVTSLEKNLREKIKIECNDEPVHCTVKARFPAPAD